MEEIMNKIINGIMKMTGAYSPYVIFTDWVKMCAISISNSMETYENSLWHKREREYLDIAAKYTPEYLKSFAELTAWLVELYDITGPYDALGEIYMKAGCGNKGTGQFFTPFHVSKLVAYSSIKQINKGEKLLVNEPSCGGGGLLLAAAHRINELGGDAQMQMDIIAQDIDWNSVYMAYVQLSLNGLSGVCIQGDSLQMQRAPKECIFETPRRRGILI